MTIIIFYFSATSRQGLPKPEEKQSRRNAPPQHLSMLKLLGPEAPREKQTKSAGVVGSVCIKPAMQLFAALPVPSGEMLPKNPELRAEKNNPKMLLFSRHAGSKCSSFNEKWKFISSWNQGTLTASAHLSLIDPA